MKSTEAFFAKKDAIIPKARYLQLQQYYSTGEKAVHVFIEDDDDFEFYRTALEFIYRDYKTIPYPMKGKQNVKDGYKEVDWRKFNKSNVLFFADKDYDDILQFDQINDSNFFYTKYYSIENYLVTKEVFLIILRRFFTAMDESTELELVKLFEAAYQLFIRKIRTLTWFILIDRENSKKANLSNEGNLDKPKNADLDKFKMSYFIHFEAMVFMEKKLTSEYNYHRIMRSDKSKPIERTLLRMMSVKEILSELCDANIEIFTFNNIMEKRKLIEPIADHKSFTRGKYDIWFLLEIVKSTSKAIENIYLKAGRIPNEKDPLPRKTSDITDRNIFDLICSKLRHSDVEAFLNHNYQIFNGHN